MASNPSWLKKGQKTAFSAVVRALNSVILEVL
nr:MAG TPA: hypothetical protein [Caudoviricetes sp.]